MYCRFCGNEITADAAFCGSCGTAQNAKTNSVKKSQPVILLYFIGAVFILCGMLPYLFRGDSAEYGTFISSVYEKYSYSAKAIIAISAFTSFSSFFSTLFYFSSSAVAFYVGLLLFKKERNFTTPVIFCAVLHILSAICSGIANLLIYYFPKFVLSLFTTEGDIVSLGESIIRTEPDLLYTYREQAVLRLVISVVLVALSIVLVIYKKTTCVQNRNENSKVSSLGNILMLLSVSTLSIIRLPLSRVFARLYGATALAADNLASSVFDQNFAYILPFAFFAVVAVAVIFNRAKRWILAIPTAGVTLILGMIALFLSYVLLEKADAQAEMFASALASLRGLIISSGILLIAVFFWFHAVAKNSIPTWLQILLPIALPFAYTAAEIVANVVLRSISVISCGILLTSLVTVILSVLIRPNQSKTT